jgi:tRNA (cmo5U34)-methyltransferase
VLISSRRAANHVGRAVAADAALHGDGDHLTLARADHSEPPAENRRGAERHAATAGGAGGDEPMTRRADAPQTHGGSIGSALGWHHLAVDDTGGAAWTEADSTLYRELAEVAVPSRAEQLAIVATLVPFGREEAFRVLDLGAGEGALSGTVLRCFPRAELVALDGSASMRARASEALSPFARRAVIEGFDLGATEWHDRLDGADCVVSSLCIHHLDAADKRQLFTAVARRASAAGALLIADLVEPVRPEPQALFAATWDRAAQQQAAVRTGSAALFRRFVETGWNLYRVPDPTDKPSPLFDQLMWLQRAGFAAVDCFWMQAGHAVYGGYCSRARPGSRSHGPDFGVALEAARASLKAAQSAPPGGPRVRKSS